MTTLVARIIIVIAFVIAIILILAMLAARAQNPDEWFRLVIELQKQEQRLDADDRKFLRYMVNVMTVEDGVMPKPEHKRWLLDIKQRLERERR